MASCIQNYLPDEIFEEGKKTIIEERYQTNVGDLFAHVRKKHSDPKIVKVLKRRKC
ncbi:glutamine--tRNA ligase [Artemisia annua]|uniref:Glutamine--tRNA ligase n=1 Tax=Artemisia annua TaxID=35608 RepID=A0A2U1PBE0_ARTAN|nr:glutamine--tRNA ligase [Artemisia annua]